MRVNSSPLYQLSYRGIGCGTERIPSDAPSSSRRRNFSARGPEGARIRGFPRARADSVQFVQGRTAEGPEGGDPVRRDVGCADAESRSSFVHGPLGTRGTRRGGGPSVAARARCGSPAQRQPRTPLRPLHRHPHHARSRQRAGDEDGVRDRAGRRHRDDPHGRRPHHGFLRVEARAGRPRVGAAAQALRRALQGASRALPRQPRHPRLVPLEGRDEGRRTRLWIRARARRTQARRALAQLRPQRLALHRAFIGRARSERRVRLHRAPESRAACMARGRPREEHAAHRRRLAHSHRLGHRHDARQGERAR